MTKKQLKKRQAEILTKLRALRGDAEAARTRFLLYLVEVGSDPERAWAAGDDVITFEQFLEDHEICGRGTYQRFLSGLKSLKQTSAAKGTTPEKLATTVGHEAVSRVCRLKKDKTRSQFVEEAVSLRAQLGRAPGSSSLDALIRKLEPAAPSGKEKERNELGRLRAEVQRLRAIESLVEPLQQEKTRLLEEIRNLKLENDRLTRATRVSTESQQRGRRKGSRLNEVSVTAD